MHLKCKIYTTEKDHWFRSDFPYIIKNLKKARGIESVSIDVETVFLDELPQVTGQGGHREPDYKWFVERFTKRSPGYNAVCLHIPTEERLLWGMKSIAGTYWWDGPENGVFEFFVSASNGERSRHYWRPHRMSEFTRIFIHELCHGFEHWTYGQDLNLTHTYDYGPGPERQTYKLHELSSVMDFTEWNRLKAEVERLHAIKWDIIRNLYHKLLMLQQRLMRPLYPIADEYFTENRISQAFGVYNPRYKITGRHIGTDFVCPVGTPIYAPEDGTLITRYTDHPTLGGMIHYSCVIDGKRYYLRFLHLSEASPTGQYRKGDIIGRTGNTGDSDGPHLHHEVWVRPIDTSILTVGNFRTHLVDPVVFWKEKVEGISS